MGFPERLTGCTCEAFPDKVRRKSNNVLFVPAVVRKLAAGAFLWSLVPVIVLDHLSETQKRAYIIADNKLALNAGWDDELLALELAALKDRNMILT